MASDCICVQQFYANRSPSTAMFTSSARILGRFADLQEIVQLKPSFLSMYLDAAKNNHSQIIIASSCNGEKLQDYIAREGRVCSIDALREWILQMLSALEHLHSNEIYVRNLSINNIIVTPDGSLSIFNYGLNFISSGDVDFTVGDNQIIAPELRGNTHSPSYQSDIWALGLIIVQIHLALDFGEQNIISRLPVELNVDLRNFLICCLNDDPRDRLNASSLQKSKLFDGVRTPVPMPVSLDGSGNSLESFTLSPKEIYSLWTIASGGLARQITIPASTKPAIFSIPNFVQTTDDVESMYLAMEERPPFVDTMKVIDMKRVQRCIKDLQSNLEIAKETLNRYDDGWKYSLPLESDYIDDLWASFQIKPASLYSRTKDRDLSYQFLRIFRFHSLLNESPLQTESLRLEAISDISPLLRGEIWAAILGVDKERQKEYDVYNNDEKDDTDRQLDLDIPRCHQYHRLLSTPTGHLKLKRVLKAWVQSEIGRKVYWQGLDSLAACFVSLNFNDEALAFTSMRSFIDKHCRGFYIQDNSKLMREHMLTFRYLLSFHDPELSYHLHQIGIGPEFYTISWFMTMFAHVFDIDKIYYLWDHFITGPEFLFMYTALSILQQLRVLLLKSDFTNAMLVFSELSDINVETCIIDSIRLAKITPPSIFDYLSDAISLSTLPHQVDDTRFSFLSTQTSILASLSAQDFHRIKSHALVIDTRSVAKFTSSHIMGSICAPEKDQVAFTPLSILDRSKYIVLISDEMMNDFGMYLLKMKQPYVSIAHAKPLQLRIRGRVGVLVHCLNIYIFDLNQITKSRELMEICEAVRLSTLILSPQPQLSRSNEYQTTLHSLIESRGFPVEAWYSWYEEQACVVIKESVTTFNQDTDCVVFSGELKDKIDMILSPMSHRDEFGHRLLKALSSALYPFIYNSFKPALLRTLNDGFESGQGFMTLKKVFDDLAEFRVQNVIEGPMAEILQLKIEQIISGLFEHYQSGILDQILEYLKVEVFALLPFFKDQESWKRRLEFHVHRTLGVMLIGKIFEIVVDFPGSEPALRDLKICLQRSGEESELIAAIQISIQKKLLIVDAQTQTILDIFLSLKKSLAILEAPTDILRQIKEYFKCRLDTTKLIVKLILESNDDGDVQLLMDIFDVPLFAKEYQKILSSQLLALSDFGVDEQVKNVSVLKARFGESEMLQANVMMRDVNDSAKIWEKCDQSGNFSALVVSRHFWPKIDMKPIDFPLCMKEPAEKYDALFRKLKSTRKLQWLNAGVVDLQIGSLRLNVTPAQASLILLFSDRGNIKITKDEVPIEEVLLLLEGSSEELRLLVQFWNSHRILEIRGDHVVSMQTSTKEFGSTTAMAIEVVSKSVDIEVIWPMLNGMLKNLGPSDLPVIHRTLSLFIPSFSSTVEQLRQTLDVMVDNEKLECDHNKYSLK